MNHSLSIGVRFIFASLSSLFILSIAGCALSPPPLPNYTYLNSGERKEKVNSYDKFTETRVYEYSYDDVFEATKTALFRKGFQIHLADKKIGLILANGSLMRRELTISALPFTASAKVTVIDRKPTTQLIVNADSYWDTFQSSAVRLEKSAHHLGNELMADIQKILTTY